MSNSGKLQITTPSECEIVITRLLNAPRHLAFAAWTKPELVKRWMLGPPGWSFVVCDIDLRVGGSYRFVWRKQDGIEMGMSGVYREILPPERLIDAVKVKLKPGLGNRNFVETRQRRLFLVRREIGRHAEGKWRL